MAVSASQLQELLKEAFPSDPAQMQVTDIMVPSGRIRYVDEIIGQGESGPMYGSRPEPEMVLGGYYSPALGRQLTAAETQHLIPIQSYVDGYGQVTTGLVYPGEKAIKLFNELGYTGSQMSGQATPGGFEVYPLPGTIPTDQGDRTNIAISYGASGAPEARAYQSSTLTGSASLDKIVDQLAKTANAALLTYVGGLALGPAGAGLLANPALAGAAAGVGQAAIKGGDTRDLLISGLGGALMAPGADAAAVAASDLAAIEASMGTPSLLGSSNILDSINQAGIYTPGVEPSLSMTPPPVISEPVLVPGDTALTGTLAQPPLTVENIAGQLTPEAQALMLSPTLPVTPLVVETPAGVLSPDTANIINTTAVEGSMTPVTTGDPTKAALYSNEGYGPLSDLTVTGAPITSSPITSLGPAATLKDVTDYLTGGAFAGNVTDALKEAFKAATGSGQQQGSGSNFLGPIIGGLLSRSPTAAPSASVTPGRPVDITSPIQSLLAPKLVQQRPVTLL
jgi:hypothetical protein